MMADSFTSHKMLHLTYVAGWPQVGLI